MTRRDERTFGVHGYTVHFWVEDGRAWVQWRAGKQRKTKSWPAEKADDARKWALAYAGERAKLRRIEGPIPTVAELWDLYQKANGYGWRPKTRVNYTAWAKEVSVITKSADELTHADADHVRDLMRARGVSHGTIRRTVGFLRQLLSFAHGRNLIARQPLLTYRYRIPKDEREVRPAEYTRDELLRIAAALDWPEQWRARNAIRLCGTFGARVNAVLHLRWDDVNFDAGTVTFQSKFDKTADTFARPMTTAARAALLEAFAHRNPSGWVFWSRYRPANPMHYNGLHWHLLEAEKRADVPHIPKRAFHGLRRMVVGDIGDLATAAAWLHHANLAVTASYVRERPENIEQAKRALEGGKP